MSRNSPVSQPVSASAVVLQTLVSVVPVLAFVVEAAQVGITDYRVPDRKSEIKTLFNAKCSLYLSSPPGFAPLTSRGSLQR